MSERRQVWETLANLVHRLENSAATALQPPASRPEPSGLEQEVRKLGKTQFKANALAEEQSTRLEKALATAQAALEQNTRLLETLADERANSARKDLLEATLPALDGLEHAIATGKGYLQTRDLAARKSDPTPAQAALVSPADRAMLAGWLDGLRLVRQRLLAILEAGEVTPIPTVGQIFDPYRHVAVGTTDLLPEGSGATPGAIVAEELAGYQSPAGVIRYAEVIVYRPKSNLQT